MNTFGGIDFSILLRGKPRDFAFESIVFLLNSEGKREQGLQEIPVWQSRTRRPHAHAMTAAKDSFVVARQITPAASCRVDRKSFGAGKSHLLFVSSASVFKKKRGAVPVLSRFYPKGRRKGLNLGANSDGPRH